MRQKYSEERVLVEHGDKLTFTEDVEFSSPSAAAAVIHGGRASTIQSLLLVTALLSVPALALAANDAEHYASIVTVDTLFEIIGDQYSAVSFEDQGTAFSHYYSAELDRSFLVDEELGTVCNTYEGSAMLSCFPCASDEVSTNCP